MNSYPGSTASFKWEQDTVDAGWLVTFTRHQSDGQLSSVPGHVEPRRHRVLFLLFSKWLPQRLKIAPLHHDRATKVDRLREFVCHISAQVFSTPRLVRLDYWGVTEDHVTFLEAAFYPHPATVYWAADKVHWFRQEVLGPPWLWSEKIHDNNHSALDVLHSAQYSIVMVTWWMAQKK